LEQYYVVISPLSARKIKWKLAETWPSTLTPLASPPAKLSALMKKMSRGKFIIKLKEKRSIKALLGILDIGLRLGPGYSRNWEPLGWLLN